METRKIFLSFLLCLAFPLLLQAQLTVTEECHVKGGDLMARQLNDTNPIVEEGDTIPFALVRVGLTEPSVSFDNRYVLKTEYKDNEYWVYVMEGVKTVTIKSKRFTPLHYSFPEPLQARTTYVMTIQKPKVDDGQLGEIKIQSNVSKAEIFIDGVKISDGAPFTYKGEGGAHTLEVKAVGYAPQTRDIEIPVGNSTNITVNLFAEGSLSIEGISYGMVPIDAVSFQMGSNNFYYEQPVRDINLMAFSIGSTMVSVELWKSVMGEADDRIKGENGQVVNVTFDECQDFIAALNEKTGKTFRLPSEAEWEYCAQNATALGIIDMQKCMEWCNDWFGKYQLTSEPSPQGAESGIMKTVRGGSLYGSDAAYSRTSYRWYQNPEKGSENISFRLVYTN